MWLHTTTHWLYQEAKHVDKTEQFVATRSMAVSGSSSCMALHHSMVVSLNSSYSAQYGRVVVVSGSSSCGFTPSTT